MDGTFTTLLRDIVVILAAAAVVAASVIGAALAWQLYRLGRQLYADVQPILDSVYGTSETVRNTAQFMGSRMHERAGAALAIVHTSRTLTLLVRDFYKGIPPSPAAAPPAMAGATAASTPIGAPAPAAPLGDVDPAAPLGAARPAVVEGGPAPSGVADAQPHG